MLDPFLPGRESDSYGENFHRRVDENLRSLLNFKATAYDKIRRYVVMVDDYGAYGDGSTDDRASIQAAIDAVYAAGGGVVLLEAGKTYKVVAGGAAIDTDTVCVHIPTNVTLNINSATLNCHVGSGNQVAVWLHGNYAKVINGTINAVSSGSPSSQYFFHCAVAIGIHLDSTNTPSSLNVGQFMYGWEASNLTLSTTRQYCPVIQLIGGAHNGSIHHIKVPDSSLCSGIYLDWGSVGTISSSDIATTRTNFDAATAYTTHPNNIEISHIDIGTMSVTASGDAGSYGVRLSGCHNVKVSHLHVDSVTQSLYTHTAGDLGFEFALASQKKLAYQNNILEHSSVRSATTAMQYGVYIDTLGDNVFRAQFSAAYTPLADPLWNAKIIVRNCSLVGGNNNSVYGARIIQARGVSIDGCTVSYWDDGILIDEFTKNISVKNCIITSNRQNGVKVGTQLLRENTQYITISGNHIYANGQTATSSGIYVARGWDVDILNNIVGAESETTQDRGIYVDDNGVTCRNVRVKDNHVLGCVVIAYQILSGSPTLPFRYRQIREFSGNTTDTNVAFISGAGLQSGTLLYPTRQLLLGSSLSSEWQHNSGSDPADGIWYAGDLIKRRPAGVSGAYSFKECTTSGQFGTLSGLTNGATSNTSYDITCSLTGITATTTQSSYQITVSSATNLRVGLKCSISAAGISNALILSISGTTLQLDTQAKSAQSAVTFSTAGLIDGEVISINTTPAISSAVVMKVNGTTVTLDTAAGSTETGRTISYTTPVFKNHANIA